jgi:PAS domain S-box-containing protein
MMEIKNYDAAANKFYYSLNIKSLPINSWDLYASYFHEVCNMYHDIFLLRKLAKSNKWSYSENFDKELLQKKYVIVVTDPQLKIVHATQNIVHMNGYLPKEVVGKKPKMFQGIDTCEKTSKLIRKAITNKNPFEVTLLNYRKDSSTYKCWIKGEPIFNKTGEVVNFIAYEKEVA